MLVPTRELGVQIALLVYRLFGGNPTAVTGIPGQPGNMFRYTGPRGLQVRRTHPAAACPHSVFVNAATATRSHAARRTCRCWEHHAAC